MDETVANSRNEPSVGTKRRFFDTLCGFFSLCAEQDELFKGLRLNREGENYETLHLHRARGRHSAVAGELHCHSGEGRAGERSV